MAVAFLKQHLSQVRSLAGELKMVSETYAELLSKRNVGPSELVGHVVKAHRIVKQMLNALSTLR